MEKIIKNASAIFDRINKNKNKINLKQIKEYLSKIN